MKKKQRGKQADSAKWNICARFFLFLNKMSIFQRKKSRSIILTLRGIADPEPSPPPLPTDLSESDRESMKTIKEYFDKVGIVNPYSSQKMPRLNQNATAYNAYKFKNGPFFFGSRFLKFLGRCPRFFA